MLPDNPELSKFVQTDPVVARERIRDAIRETSGNLAQAARTLGVGRRTLTRWIARLELEEEVKAFREEVCVDGCVVIGAHAECRIDGE